MQHESSTLSANDFDELQALEHLARESSSERRRELMARLSALFTEGVDAYSDENVVIFGDILLRLLDQVEEPDRAALSQRVAPCHRTPRVLVKTLAQDESMRVAEPVLSESPVLTDEDLVEIATEQSQGHLMAMSRRKQLSGTVTDAIIRRGSQPVLQSVTKNIGADITEQGYMHLAQEAPGNRGLMDALSQRADIPESVAENVIAILPPAYKTRLQYLLNGSATRRDELFNEAAKQMQKARLACHSQRLDAKVAARDIIRGNRSLDDVIQKFAGSNRPREVAVVLSLICGLPEKYVSAALLKMNGSGIALICKSIDLKDTAFEEVALMRCTRLRLPSSQATRLLQVYRSLDAMSARRTLRFVKARSMSIESAA